MNVDGVGFVRFLVWGGLAVILLSLASCLVVGPFAFLPMMLGFVMLVLGMGLKAFGVDRRD